MKKLIGLSALFAVLLLVACGGGTEEMVCTVSAELFGYELTITAQVEGDVVTAVVMETRQDISGEDEETIELMLEAWEGSTIDGNYIILVESSDDEEMDLDEFLEDIEILGGSCD